MFAIDALFHRDCYDYYWDVYIHGQPFWSKDLEPLKLGKFGSAFAHFTFMDVSVPGSSIEYRI